MFTVETVSLGHFLQVPFPLFIQRGEEEHFLKGKPAFQAQMKSKRFNKSADRGTIFVFHLLANKHMHAPLGPRTCVCLLSLTRTHTHSHTPQIKDPCKRFPFILTKKIRNSSAKCLLALIGFCHATALEFMSLQQQFIC